MRNERRQKKLMQRTKKNDRSLAIVSEVAFIFFFLFLSPSLFSSTFLSFSPFLSISLHFPLSLRQNHSAAIRIIYLSRSQRELRWVEGSFSSLPFFRSASLFLLYQFATLVYASVSETGKHFCFRLNIYTYTYIYSASVPFSCSSIKFLRSHLRFPPFRFLLEKSPFCTF